MGKTIGVGGWSPCPWDGARSGVCTDLPLAACSLTGGGGAHVCVRLCRFCGTGRGADANWKRELTHVGLGISGFRTRFCSAGRQSCQGARWGLYPHLSRDSHSGPRTRLLTLSRDCPPPNAQTLRLTAPPHTDAAVCFCWVCQCCLCSRDCVIA